MYPRTYRPAVIADANALIEDAMRRARGRFSLMPFLAERGVIRLVAAEHIDAKVYARLPTACGKAHVDVGAATHAYETLHRPLLRLVSVGDLMLHDERVAAVSLVDAEDVPVAQLGVLLAPSLVLTRDSHLLDAGIGVREWADSLVLLKHLVELDQAIGGAADGFLMTGAAAAYGIGGLVYLLRRSRLALGIALGLSVVLGYRFRHNLREAPGQLKARGEAALDRTFEQLAPAFEQRNAADSRLRPTLVRPHDVESIESAVGSVLLQSPKPLPGAEVCSRLPYRWRNNTVEDVMEVLREQSAFELVRGRGWRLGHPATRSRQGNGELRETPDRTIGARAVPRNGAG